MYLNITFRTSLRVLKEWGPILFLQFATIYDSQGQNELLILVAKIRISSLSYFLAS